jgi:hypothetical protein
MPTFRLEMKRVARQNPAESSPRIRETEIVPVFELVTGTASQTRAMSLNISSSTKNSAAIEIVIPLHMCK